MITGLFIAGKKHMNTDALSRCISTITSPEDTTNENTYEGNSDKMNEYNDADK